VKDSPVKRPFGSVKLSVAVVGQGTWQMERDDRAGAIEALRRGLDAGLTHVDTAEMYGSGVVEEIVGEAITGRRDEVFLASKVLPSNASFKGTLRACEQSLSRLRVERLDLYLLHWPGSHPLEQTIAAFEKLVEQGKITAWGLSNFDADGVVAEGLRCDDPIRASPIRSLARICSSECASISRSVPHRSRSVTEVLKNVCSWSRTATGSDPS